MTSRQDNLQERLDRLYFTNGPCCAGCDWWRSINVRVGECAASPPVSGAERIAMLEMHGMSVSPGAGHVLTISTHHCGQFKDGFDWSQLPLTYRISVGDPSARAKS